MARSRSRTSSNKKDRTYLVNYEFDPYEEPYTFLIKAKNEKEAKELATDYYIDAIIEQSTKTKYKHRALNSGGIKDKIKREIKEIDALLKKYSTIIDYPGYVEIGDMLFYYQGITATEIFPEEKIIPLFDEIYM